MKILQTNRFKKAYKKLHPHQLPEVNSVIETVIAKPEIGERKKGSLSWLYVYKFKVPEQMILLAYSFDKDVEIIVAVDIGSHENFYRDLE